MLIGILGDKVLSDYGYPHSSGIRILHRILDKARVEVIRKSCYLVYIVHCGTSRKSQFVREQSFLVASLRAKINDLKNCVVVLSVFTLFFPLQIVEEQYLCNEACKQVEKSINEVSIAKCIQSATQCFKNIRKCLI